MTTEIWKDVVGFEGLYQVSNFGNLRNKWGRLISNRRMKWNGYLEAVLSKDNKKHYFRIHRLVAEAFLPNPLNLPVINHINSNRSDNRVDNLEWTTQKHNVSLAKGKKVALCDSSGNVIKEFESIRDASRITGLTKKRIKQLIAGKTKYKKPKDGVWKYVS